jgi:hypothetical protein
MTRDPHEIPQRALIRGVGVREKREVPGEQGVHGEELHSSC